MPRTKLRQPQPAPIRQVKVYGTDASHGLSGQTGLSPGEQKEQADAMGAYAGSRHGVNNPIRRGREYDPMDGVALGRFVKAVHSDRDLRQTRFLAGCAYAETVDNDLVARGFKPRSYGLAGASNEPLTFDQLQARKELCAIKLANAEDALREVDNLTVRVIRQLCHEDLDIPANWHGRAISGLYKLAIHFRFERLPFHA